MKVKWIKWMNPFISIFPTPFIDFELFIRVKHEIPKSSNKIDGVILLFINEIWTDKNIELNTCPY